VIFCFYVQGEAASNATDLNLGPTAYIGGRPGDTPASVGGLGNYCKKDIIKVYHVPSILHWKRNKVNLGYCEDNAKYIKMLKIKGKICQK
jgi:hypothetical protein